MNPTAQPTPSQPTVPDTTPFKTDVVQNIPMQTQAPAEPVKVNDDVELDLMMQDVGQELKKNVKRPSKHHFFSKKPKATEIPQPKFEAQPVPISSQPVPPAPAAKPQAQAQNSTQPHSKPPAKPKTKHSVPIFIILVTTIITGVLIVLAVAAYKQK